MGVVPPTCFLYAKRVAASFRAREEQVRQVDGTRSDFATRKNGAISARRTNTGLPANRASHALRVGGGGLRNRVDIAADSFLSHGCCSDALKEMNCFQRSAGDLSQDG